MLLFGLFVVLAPWVFLQIFTAHNLAEIGCDWLFFINIF